MLGLEHNGVPLLNAMCPPYYPSMEAAVRAVVDAKVGPQGIFRGGAIYSAWRDPERVAEVSPAPSEANIQAAIAYCKYVFNRYGRFPAYAPPMRTVLGFQVNHLDVEFHDRYYRPEALSEAQREHLKRRHDTGRGAASESASQTFAENAVSVSRSMPRFPYSGFSRNENNRLGFQNLKWPCPESGHRKCLTSQDMMTRRWAFQGLSVPFWT